MKSKKRAAPKVKHYFSGFYMLVLAGTTVFLLAVFGFQVGLLPNIFLK